MRNAFGIWRRNERGRYFHEGIIIARTAYGFTVTSIRRNEIFLIDPQSGVAEQQEGWTIVSVWYVGPNKSANFEPLANPDNPMTRGRP